VNKYRKKSCLVHHNTNLIEEVTTRWICSTKTC